MGSGSDTLGAAVESSVAEGLPFVEPFAVCDAPEQLEVTRHIGPKEAWNKSRKSQESLESLEMAPLKTLQLC